VEQNERKEREEYQTKGKRNGKQRKGGDPGVVKFLFHLMQQCPYFFSSQQAPSTANHELFEDRFHD
jgi:hypothetical protein